MMAPRAWIACLLALLASAATAEAQGTSKPVEGARSGDAGKSPSTLGSTSGSGVYSGYGNYWYPTGYPYPSIGGSGYTQFGFGSVNPYYYSVPGSSSPAASLTSNTLGGVANAVRPRAATPKGPASGPKSVTSPRKPR